MDEKLRFYEFVNKYYYDIESMKVYFGSYLIWKQGYRAIVSVIMIVSLFLSIYHFLLIITFNALKIFNSNIFNFYGSYSASMIWVGYIISLIIYVLTLVFIEIKKTNILYDKYHVNSMKDVQSIWLADNLPNSLNKFKLVNKSYEWLNNYRKIQYKSNININGIMDNKVFDIILNNMIPFIGIAIFASLFGDYPVKDLLTNYPKDSVSLIISIIVLGVMFLFLFSMVKMFLYRLISAIDGYNSKNFYRMDRFNIMLLQHVTLDELEKS